MRSSVCRVFSLNLFWGVYDCDKLILYFLGLFYYFWGVNAETGL